MKTQQDHSNEAYVASHSMHGRVVMRSPLGDPSPEAARFLAPPERYDNFVEPDAAIEKAGALADAQRVARELRGENDQTPRLCRRAGDVSPNDLRLLAVDVDEMAVRLRAARCVDQAETVEAVACDLREQAKAIELLALEISEGLEDAA